MQITIKINKNVKGHKCLPEDGGSVTFTQQDLEDMALRLYLLTEETSSKFDYSASMDIIEVD